MTDWNKALKRLITRHLVEDAHMSEEQNKLFQSISNLLDERDKEYALLNRIMDLSSDELFSANSELRKRNEELDQFVYSSSHDLRAPLASITGLLELLERTESEKKKKQYMSHIKRSTQQLDSFIQEIISYTHNKKVEVVCEPIDFSDIVTRSFEKHEFMHTDRPVQVITDIKNSQPFHSDPRRLNNLFSNLISNSIKYYDPHKDNPYVKVTVRDQDKHAFIQVEDNGIGIGKIHQSKVFDMFYRASSSSKGSGIGLYIVKEILDKLDGQISLESELTFGSKFNVVLPNQMVA